MDTNWLRAKSSYVARENVDTPRYHTRSASAHVQSGSSQLVRRNAEYSAQHPHRVRAGTQQNLVLIRNRELLRSVYYGVEPRPLTVILEATSRRKCTCGPTR